MEKFLSLWLQKGFISEEQYQNLKADYTQSKEKTRKTRVQITLYIIGALLLGFGVLLFIAANDWLIELLNRLNFLKISILFILASTFLYKGYKLAYENSKFPKLGSSLIFLSTLLIGGVYALLGQIYNLEANSAIIYFVWFLSVFPLAFIFKSQPVNILSCVLFILSTIFYYDKLPYNNDFVWFVFIPIILGGLFYTFANIEKVEKDFNSFSLSYKMTGLFAIFITLLILTFFNDLSLNVMFPVYVVPVCVLGILSFINYGFRKEKTELIKTESVYIFSLMIYLLLIMVLPVLVPLTVKLIAHLFIIIMIVFIYSNSYKFENKSLSSLANKLLAIYILVNYIRFGSEYLTGSALFTIAGVILLLLGIYNEKKKRLKENKWKKLFL